MADDDISGLGHTVDPNALPGMPSTPADDDISGLGHAVYQTPHEDAGPSFGSMAKQAGLGIAEGVMSMPDILTNPDRVGWNILSGFFGGPKAQTFEDAYRGALQSVNLDPSQYPAQNAPERIIRGTARALPYGVNPEGIVGNLASAAASGFTGSAAEELVPDQYKPAANLIGSVIGGGAAAAAPAAARAAARAVGPSLPGRLGQSAAESAAGRELERLATNPDAIRNAPQAPELVPGSKPTLFQATGDQGVGQAEREFSRRADVDRNTGQPYSGSFNQRRDEQNAARTSAITGVEEGGQPLSLSQQLQDRLSQIDTQTQASIDQAANRARAAVPNVGMGLPEEYGAQFRQSVQQAETAAKAQESALWNAIDPDRQLTVQTGPLSGTVGNIYGNLGRAGMASLSGAENNILGVIGGYGPVVHLQELTELRSLVTSEMRAAKLAGQAQPYGRMSQVLRGIDQSIGGSVDAAAGAASRVDPLTQRIYQAYLAGRTGPSSIVDASTIVRNAGITPQQFTAWMDSGPPGVRDMRSTYSKEPQARANRLDVGGGRDFYGIAFDGPPGPAQPQESLSSIVQRTHGQAPPAPMPLNMTQGALDTMEAARAATADRAQTFGTQPVKQVLRREGQNGPYQLPDSSVPAKVFHPGNSGFQDAQAYLNAGGDPQALRDFAAMSARRAAMRPDGTVDPQALANWADQHSDALRAVPDVLPRFQNAATASEAMAEAVASRRTAMDAAQKGNLGKLIGADNPNDVTRIVGGILGQRDAATQMERLAQLAQQDTTGNATQGLRRAIVDHMLSKVVGTAEAGTSGVPQLNAATFQKFIAQNQAALSKVFTPEELNTWNAVAADMQRSNRSLVATKIPGGSDTNQNENLTRAAKSAAIKGGSSILRMVLSGFGAAVGAGSGFGLPGAMFGAAASAAGEKIVQSVRAAGLGKRDDIIKEALLNPALAKSLLQRVSNEPRIGATLAQRIGRAAMIGLDNQPQ